MNQTKTDFVEIFQTIRASLQPYAVMGFDNRENSETVYDLWSNKNVEIEGEKKNELFFASVVIHESRVAFHLMPDDLRQHHEFEATVLKQFSGNTGFEIKELDEALLSQIEDALAEGYKIYKEKAWV
ncbi:MAG: hypothetical protein V4594_19425 [Bacteroidota bacterium]